MLRSQHMRRRVGIATSAMCLAAAMLCRGQGVITTVAGADPGYPSNSFPALSASFGQLSGVAVSPAGDVYFASTTRSLIMKFSPRLNAVSIVAGITFGGYSGDGGPAVKAALNSPQQITFDPGGNLYVADFQNNAIRKIDTQGIITTYATIPGGAWSVAIAADGSVYVSTFSQIFHINSNGTQTLIAGSTQSSYGGDNGPAIDALFNHIQGLVFDKAGNLLVADTGNNAIRRINPQGIVTTIAGNEQYGTSVSGPATSTSIGNPVGLGLDAQGNLYTGTITNQLLKIDAKGTLTVLNSTPSTYFLNTPGPVAQAIFHPQFPAVDSAGNLYFTDQTAGYLWEVTAGGLAQAAAAYAPNFFIGDNGPAVLAGFNFPNGIWLETDGSLLVADQYNGRIRKISPSGTITTVIGNGSLGTTNVGPALSVSLNAPTEVAADSSGNIYVAIYGSNILRYNSSSGIVSSFYTGNSFVNAIAVDAQGNLLVAIDANQILRITPAGVVSVVAGNGQQGYSGDGGPAVKAMLYGPQGVASDSAGNIYIGDSYNGVVRKVSPNGIISTIAGIYGQGSPIVNGVPATQSALHFPTALACDGSGDVYVADTYGSQVRVISANGNISAVAGTGTAAFSGDGGPATAASLNQAGTLAVDGAGNVYISDRLNNRIRKILAAPVAYQAAPTSLSFSANSGGSAPGAQGINLTSTVSGLSFTTSTNVSWLSVSPSSGTVPSVPQVSVDPTGLTPNTYQGTVTINAPNASPSTKTIAVSFTVGGGTPSRLAVSSQSLPFSLAQGASPGNAQVTISNTGSGSTRYAASATTANGGNWLQISSSSGSTSGSVTAASPASLNVTATPGTLAVGTYNGTITVTGPDTGQTLTVTVILAITAAPPTILLSQLGLTFTAVAQGGTVLPQMLGILNSGSGMLSYSVQATTQSGGSGWLSVSPNTGTVARPLLDVSSINVNVNTNQLPPPGTYYGQISVSAAGASNSPQVALVVLNVLPPGTDPGPDVRPTGLVFIGAAGAENPGAQDVTVANVTGSTIKVAANVSSPTVPDLIDSKPADFTVPPDQPGAIVVQPDFASLAAGQYGAGILVYTDSGMSQTVNVLSVVAPAGTPVGDASADKVRPMGSAECPTAASCCLNSRPRASTRVSRWDFRRPSPRRSSTIVEPL